MNRTGGCTGQKEGGHSAPILFVEGYVAARSTAVYQAVYRSRARRQSLEGLVFKGTRPSPFYSVLEGLGSIALLKIGTRTQSRQESNCFPNKYPE